MTSQNKVINVPFKIFLWLIAAIFAVAAVLLIILSTSADTIVGETPASAIPLAEEVNRGKLDPGEQHWFTFTPGDQASQPAQVEKKLTLIFTPDDGNTIRFVSLQIFEQDQIQFFYQGDTGKMANLGAGQVVSRDNNPETGEFFWNGWVSSQKTYFIQVLNNSDFEIDYWLFNDNVRAFSLGEPEQVQPEEVASMPAPPVKIGTNPGNAAPLLSSTNRGTVEPHSTYWYTFNYRDIRSLKRFQNVDFSMFFTPDDGNLRHHINFELFPASEIEIWRRGDLDKLTNFGAGMLVSRDGDPNTGERIWRGVVLTADTYLLAVENSTDVEIEYWIFNGDIYNPELGPKPAPKPAPVFAAAAAPQTAVPLKFGLNKGALEPGKEAWYSFSITDFDDEAFEEMALTMITTPDDGNRIWNMTFDVFTADGTRYWSPGNNSQISNIGAGSVVYRDDNPLTGERFWQGWVVDNDLYYVQIRNNSQVHMDYWLFTGNVYRPELGEKPIPLPRVAAKPGTAPYAPIELEVGVNRGTLEPRHERWYTFSRSDVDRKGSVETIFTLIFTPDDGNRIRDVNFELFEASQLRDWAPDNRFNLKNFGQGSVVSRDGDINTGEMLWKGHVLSGDLYFIRVSNESDVTIDYWISPDDVINANLTP